MTVSGREDATDGGDPAGPAGDPASPAGSARRSGPNDGPARSPGWREVLLAAAAVVVVVLGLAALTGLLPTELQRLVFHSPLAIIVLVVGTVLVLWRVAGRGERA